MADKLKFDLVSPERRLFAGAVDMVVVPGEEGDFGVLPGHAPVMSAIRPGAIAVHDGGKVERTFINGGFAEVAPEGLTILAEDAVPLASVDRAQLGKDIAAAKEDLADAKTDEGKAAAQAALSRLQALEASLG
ncbi:MAG: F0F1 ATP synthase subunit epsilon [Maricaulaceae bacterium]|nr:F0F1 ATP synthase subunit epsilon [Maricaulaceae bacterium]